MTARHIRDQYAGASGVLGAGDKTVRAAINRAVEEGEMMKIDGVLHLASGSE